LSGRDHERALLDARREAHWSLRLALQDVARRSGRVELERLYDEARRSDNQLADFYQARADVLERQRRDAWAGPERRPVPISTHEPHADVVATDPISMAERALLVRFRLLDGDDRAALLRMAARLATANSDGA
jgi:hypothetical protein